MKTFSHKTSVEEANSETLA